MDTEKATAKADVVERPASTANSRPSQWKNLRKFTANNIFMLIALSLGTTGALACFAFTYWLSGQIFYCPPWTTQCNVQHSVHWFISRLGFVQGFLSSLYQICIAMIAYATYQFAETTVWPVLTEHALTLGGVDHYLAHARGSLPSFPYAAFHARNTKHVAVVITVGMVGILLQASATIVGWAFTLVPVATTLHSNHTTGGGMGFGLSQFNPPGPVPSEPSMALALYSGWSNAQNSEMLPDLRDFLIDRTNFSLIGNFTVPTLQARKQINCYGDHVNITHKPFAPDYSLYTVGTKPKPEFGGSLLTEPDEVLLRFLPNTLAVWVDNYWNLSETRAVTKLMFGMINGTIEDGLNHQHSEMISDACVKLSGNVCSGISILACEVDIDLVESQACNGKCEKTTASSLTSLDQTAAGGSVWALSVWLGAVPSVMGPNIWGAQPMFTTGLGVANSTYALPQAYSDILGGGVSSWSKANLTNFINVTSAALGIYVAQSWPKKWTIVESKLDLPRLNTQRTFALLAPPGIALLSVVLLVILSEMMHRNAGLSEVRLGSTSEILICSGTEELKVIVEEIRAEQAKPEVLDEKHLWFGKALDGHAGLGTKSKVTSFED